LLAGGGPDRLGVDQHTVHVEGHGGDGHERARYCLAQ
jgi:hypothetical protein